MKLGNTKKKFEILPEGMHNAVLAAVQDLGLVQSPYNGQEEHKIRFVWVTDQKNSKNEPIIAVRAMTDSLYDKSTMGKMVKGILGQLPNDGDGIDSSDILGRQCQLVITHNEANGNTYANVSSVVAPKEGVKVEVPNNWMPPKVNTNKTSQERGSF